MADARSRTGLLVARAYTSQERFPTMHLPKFGSVWTSTSPHAGSSESESESATILDRQVGLKLKHSNDSLSRHWLFLFLLLWVMGAHLTGCAHNRALPDLAKGCWNEYFPVLRAACFTFICLYASQCGCEKHNKCAVSALLWTFHPWGPDAGLWQRLPLNKVYF